jgi:putative tricarboxylic transport membrane protein
MRYLKNVLARLTFFSGERVVLLGIVSIAAYFGFFSFEYRIGALNDPQPGFFPLVISLLVLAIAAGLFFFSKKRESKAVVECSQQKEATKTGSIKQILLLIAVVLAYTLILEPLGFLIPSFFLFLALLKIMKLHGWVFPVVLSLVVVVAAWLLFKVWLGVQLPEGGSWHA